MEYSVRVPFGRAEWAEMVFNTLSVDTELKEGESRHPVCMYATGCSPFRTADVVQRHYKVEKDVFEATFKVSASSCGLDAIEY